ncbi:hypothetical protein LA080_005619 [Diaporthe eres]|uniref:N-acetyltransferase domain-containing protein n=1 Tax=Diaporthe vaccinii TaxID=105482 RepID=A0ABR4F155_9PEZI|nr:hypothetical protein LA080_005619 [Diaporthe eres]
MMNPADGNLNSSANALAPWTPSPPFPRGLPNHRPREGEHRPPRARPRIFRHPHGGRGEVGPLTLSVTAVEDAPPLQIHNTDPVGARKHLTVVNVPFRAKGLAATLLKETHARLCVKHVALLFPTMRDQYLDDSRGTAHGRRADQIPGIVAAQRKVATGSTGIGTSDVVDIEVLHRNLSHRGSAV